jgi:hypothetical protein
MSLVTNVTCDQCHAPAAPVAFGIARRAEAAPQKLLAATVSTDRISQQSLGIHVDAGLAHHAIIPVSAKQTFV